MGHHNIRIDGDTFSSSGVWGPSTSRANFCEEDYALTLYIAEFINSITNIAYVYYALRFMYGPGSHGLFAPRLDFMSISLLVLGIGSFLFHASMQQALEFVDELSMFGLIWSMLQAMLTMKQSPAKHRSISVGLAIIFTSFSAFYLQSGKIIYHVIAFLSSVFVLCLRGEYLFHWIQPGFPKEKTRDWFKRSWQSIAICSLGYGLWNIDLEYCAELRAIREHLGLPWAWLFELHGWWHILTAVGASQFMDVAREMQEEANRQNADDKIVEQ
ncbi:Fc.00g005780.m01.CDS01 [Cosmosporella sp. VM-42]